jgi:hypothetical protein
MISAFNMQKITVSLRNCYGIKKLDHTFDFSARRAYAIYAPNGSMKTSFAETFKDISEGEQPKDRIFPERKSTAVIKDEAGSPLPSQSVLVLPPYDAFFKTTGQTSTLLVNNTLRTEYDKLNAELNASKAMFLTAIKEQSKSKKGIDVIEQEISNVFSKTTEGEAFYDSLIRIKREVNQQADATLADFHYDYLFDPKVLAIIESKESQKVIGDYIEHYNKLIDSSVYFRRGVFEYYNGGQIAKALSDNGFFKAKHFVTLHGDQKREISTKGELEALINEEIDRITSDKSLKKEFDALRKMLEKNEAAREFNKYLSERMLLLPNLSNLALFKDKLWKSYFKARETMFNDLIEQFEKVSARRTAIHRVALEERTLWDDAITEFNERFFVPFQLKPKNKAAVVLGQPSSLDIIYTFNDDLGSAQVSEGDLKNVLSQGEKKALYILNVIFEIEARKKSGQETLFVIDDIADSFDYRNKYAIVQYLSDISNGPVFKQILLTHNFDFYRTIEGRFVDYGGCLMATKTASEIILNQAQGIKNPFVKQWKQHFFSDAISRIACISFIRNLIEYTQGDSGPDYLKLTSLLHWKADSESITQADLDEIYKGVCAWPVGSYPNQTEPVMDSIFREATACMTAGGGANFANKIVLSIAIRLAAEKFMVSKIADPAFVAAITKSQTYALLKKFKSSFPTNAQAIKVLDCVMTMTPENIHLNAFMFEPILDMSDEHLRKLYRNVTALT